MAEQDFIPPGGPPPVPLQSLSYSQPPMTPARPGLVTAIGILAIILGIMGLFSSLGTAGYAVGMYMMPKLAAMSAAPPGAGASTVAPLSVVTVMPAADVSVAVNTLKKDLSLSAAQVRELDRLIRLHGREVLGVDEDDPALTPAKVRAGLQPPASAPLESDGTAHFTTAQGTVTIGSDCAKFDAANGGVSIRTSTADGSDDITQSHQATTTIPGPTGNTPPTANVATTNPLGTSNWSVTTTTNGVTTTTTNGVTTTTGGSSVTLTATQVQQIVSAAATRSGGRLNTAQLAALTSLLSAPSQTLVTATGPTAVITANAPPFGNATVSFDTGTSVFLSPTGQVVSTFSPQTAFKNLKIDWNIIVLVGIEALTLAGLALYLIIVGIMVLRGSFAAPRLLRIYAWLKIPVNVATDVTMAVVTYDFISAFAGPLGGGGGASSMLLAQQVLWGLVGLAFPVGVLIALRSRAVRDYYNSATSQTR